MLIKTDMDDTEHKENIVSGDICQYLPKQEMPSPSVSLCDVKEEIRYCQSCSHCDADFVRLKSHIFQHHPTAAAVAANSSDEANCSVHDIKFFCVKEACTFSATLCDIYEEHLMSCCLLSQNLSEDTEERLKSTLKFILDFHNKHSIKTVSGFLDYVSIFNTTFMFTNDNLQKSNYHRCTNSSYMLADSVIDDSASCGSNSTNSKNMATSVPTLELLCDSKDMEFDSKLSETDRCDNTSLCVEDQDRKYELLTKLHTGDSYSVSENIASGTDIIGPAMNKGPLVEETKTDKIQEEVKVFDGNYCSFEMNDMNEQTGKLKKETPSVGLTCGLRDNGTGENTDLLLDSNAMISDSDSLHYDMKRRESGKRSPTQRLLLVIECRQIQNSPREEQMKHPSDRWGESLGDEEKFILNKRKRTGKKPPTCRECGKTYSNNSVLIQHMRIHTGEKPFVCSECGKGFNCKGKLVIHMRTHTGEKPFRCDQCGKTYKDISHVINHKKKIHYGHVPHKYKCDECGKHFDQSNVLIQHMRVHTGEKPFHCDECGKDFAYRCSLLEHLSLHRGEKLYKFECPECGKILDRKGKLIQHIKSHTGSADKPFLCEECGWTFYRKGQLMKHKENHAQPVIHKSNDKPFICQECDKCFSKEILLINHMKTHAEKELDICSECGKGFVCKAKLARHMRTHTKEKPFKCDECDKSYRDKGDLVKHIRTHTGEKPFKCHVCGTGFTQRNILRNHLKTHTGEKPFLCNVCGKRFGYTNSLLKHMKSHSGVEPFKCQECNKCFDQKNELSIHMRTHTVHRI